MTSTSATPDRVYTNGRLIVDEEMAFDLEALLRLERLRLLDLRAEMADAGIGDGVTFYDKRLARLRRLRKRLDALMTEKDWGVVEDGA